MEQTIEELQTELLKHIGSTETDVKTHQLEEYVLSKLSKYMFCTKLLKKYWFGTIIDCWYSQKIYVWIYI